MDAPRNLAGKGRILVPLGLMVLTLAWIGYLLVEQKGQPAVLPVPEELTAVLYPEPKPLSPFTLDLANGKPFNLQTVQNGWTFLFFGYTHCPDICPMALGVMAEVLRILDKEGSQGVRGIFVSVDPERDTLSLLADYTSYFHPAIQGTTGSASAIASFTAQMGAMFILHKTSKEDVSYGVSHTSSLFLVDPKGRLVARFSPPHQASVVANQFKQIRTLQSEGVLP